MAVDVMDVLSELSRFDQEFTPRQQLPSLESLPDAYYDFEITSAQFDRTEQQRLLVVRGIFKVLNGSLAGTMVEHLWFLDTPKKTDRFGGELKTLGFDVDQWKAPHRPFSQELSKALIRMTGMKFRARKSTKPKADKPGEYFTNMEISGPLKAGMAPPPAPVVASPLPVTGAPAPSQTPTPTPTYKGPPSEDIPF